MSKRKWIFIGCGGCLGVVVLGVVLVSVFAYWASQLFGHFPESVQEMESEHRALQKEFPFELNLEGVLEAERIDKFFNVRDQTIASANEHLPWLLRLGEESLPMQKEGRISIFKNVLMSVSQFPRVGVERAYALRGQGMSLNEYERISRVLSIELVSWREMEEGGLHRQTADAYFQPLINFEDNVEAYKANRPWHGINDNDEITLERYVQEVKRDLDQAGKNREAFAERAERIASASAAVFVDMWTNQFQ